MRTTLILVPIVCSFLLTACTSVYHAPLDRSARRDTLLRFGYFVQPDAEHNPIDPPERFIGYHSGLDFEILPGEETATVPVYAMCPGEVIYSAFAEGYGGLVVHHCIIDEEQVTVMYGHLKVDSLVDVGTMVTAGQQIGVLGESKTQDTDGNRKHLHFGIHRGPEMDTLGYAENSEQLDGYMDPAAVLGLRRSLGNPEGLQYQDPA